MRNISRRSLLVGGLVIGAASLAGCRPGSTPQSVRTIPTAAPLTPSPGQRLVEATLSPAARSIDIGTGSAINTWTYGDSTLGPLLRADAGALLRIRVDNQLPDDTTVHWHGIAMRNVADGVPGITQNAIAAGETYTYDFVAPDPGTYFYHPHVGLQLDRGLSGPLIIDDPNEPGDYDLEWIVVLDDWTDGVGLSPDEILTNLTSAGSSGMGGMGMSRRAATTTQLTGDVSYPYYLINGRIPASPTVFEGSPGQRVRIRFINAGTDTIFRVALGGHVMSITHTDGFACEPADADAFIIAMGERYDVLVTLGDGAFALVAEAEGKEARGFAVVRTSTGAAPDPSAQVSELSGRVLSAFDLTAAESARMSNAKPDATHDIALSVGMGGYVWTINGQTFGNDTPISVTEGERVRMSMFNHSMMTHPMHIHGHTWSLPAAGGIRKDTVIVPPMQSVVVDLHADNPGAWAYHCHNIYHAEAGMMTTVEYTS